MKTEVIYRINTYIRDNKPILSWSPSKVVATITKEDL